MINFNSTSFVTEAVQLLAVLMKILLVQLWTKEPS